MATTWAAMRTRTHGPSRRCQRTSLSCPSARFDGRDAGDQQQGDEHQVGAGQAGDAADGDERRRPGAGQVGGRRDGHDERDADEEADRGEHAEQPASRRDLASDPNAARAGACGRVSDRSRSRASQPPPSAAAVPAPSPSASMTSTPRAGGRRRPRVRVSRGLSPEVHEREMNESRTGGYIVTVDTGDGGRRNVNERQRRSAARRLLEEGFGDGDLSVVDEYAAADFIEHQDGAEGSGPDAVKRSSPACTSRSPT